LFAVGNLAGGLGGFKLLANSNPIHHTSTFGYSVTNLLKIVLAGTNGLKFQSAPGLGAMWIPSLGAAKTKTLRSKRTSYGASFPTSFPTYNVGSSSSSSGSVPHRSTILKDRQGDFYLLFQFQPSGSQVDYGWLHLNGHANSGLDTEVVDMAYDDSGALIAAGQTQAPEPANAIPTGLAALALGASGLRRWRKSREDAA
jgi:hypothetical protein